MGKRYCGRKVWKLNKYMYHHGHCLATPIYSKCLKNGERCMDGVTLPPLSVSTKIMILPFKGRKESSWSNDNYLL